MNGLRFAWDPKKARANIDKHGVSFEEARSVFYCSESTRRYLIFPTGYQGSPDTTGTRWGLRCAHVPVGFLELNTFS